MSNKPHSLAPPRGMRDFYPEDAVVRNAIMDTWRTVAGRYGFVPYDACVVESLDLLTRKAGEEIVDQIYAFKDKSGRDLALRPEMTPTLARMVAARQGALDFPLKWSTVAQCFRYERMTRGRKREHYQWNLDIIGEPAVTAEVEVLAAAIEALPRLGLQPGTFRIHISNRALLAEILSGRGIAAEHHAAVFLALDKRGKQDDDTIAALLRTSGVPASAAKAIFDIMALGTLEDVREAGHTGPALERLEACLAGLAAYGLAQHCVFDIGVIRGLAYYTGIVFEAFDTDRQFRAIFGGGRYDNLLATVGGKPQTGVGLGFGDVVIAEILAEITGSAARSPHQACLALGYMEPTQHGAAMALAASLRAGGDRIDLSLRPEKARAFFARAGKRGYARAIYLGPDDVAGGTVQVKDLATGAQQALALPGTPGDGDGRH